MERTDDEPDKKSVTVGACNVQARKDTLIAEGVLGTVLVIPSIVVNVGEIRGWSAETLLYWKYAREVCVWVKWAVNVVWKVYSGACLLAGLGWYGGVAWAAVLLTELVNVVVSNWKVWRVDRPKVAAERAQRAVEVGPTDAEMLFKAREEIATWKSRCERLEGENKQLRRDNEALSTRATGVQRRQIGRSDSSWGFFK